LRIHGLLVSTIPAQPQPQPSPAATPAPVEARPPVELEGAQARARTDDRCDLCGAFTDLRFGDQRICESCYEARASCCLEFGADDLWRERNDL
jgi:hypothetical protein